MLTPRHWLMVALLALAALLCACAPTAATDQTGKPRSPFDSPASTAPLGSPTNPDRRCKVDADCVVKNVGNCCGEYPQCVRKDARVDPKAVMDQCAKSGMAGVCGFPVLEGCTCVQGQCRGVQKKTAL